MWEVCSEDGHDIFARRLTLRTKRVMRIIGGLLALAGRGFGWEAKRLGSESSSKLAKKEIL